MLQVSRHSHSVRYPRRRARRLLADAERTQEALDDVMPLAAPLSEVAAQRGQENAPIGLLLDKALCRPWHWLCAGMDEGSAEPQLRLRPVRGVDLKIGLGVAWNKILWGVDSVLHRGRVGSLENLPGGSSCLRQPTNPRSLPLSASILAQSSFHWNSYVQMQAAWPRLFIPPIMAGPA